MNILYLCTYYHRAMIFRDAMDSLEARGHQLKAFNAALIGEEISDKYKNIMDDKVIHSECYKQYDRYLYFTKQKKIFKSMESKLSISEFELLHSHFLFNGGWAAYMVKKKYGIPYVISVRSGDINEFLKIPFFIPVARKIIDNASGILFLSGCYRTQLIEKCCADTPEKVMCKSAIVPNGLEPFWLQNLGNAKTLHADKKVRLLTVGKIDRRKNMKAVVEAAEGLSKEGIDASVTVIGQVLDRNIEKYLLEHPLVTVIPYLTKEELIDYYRMNDIFVMPSFRESFGRVYAEAMSQGLPVIYTKNQGFDGIFPDGEVGFSVNPHAVNEIVDSVKSIMMDYSAMSSRCVNSVQQFDWDNIAERLERFYDESIKRTE